jgi:hypothetical protein
MKPKRKENHEGNLRIITLKTHTMKTVNINLVIVTSEFGLNVFAASFKIFIS